MAKEKKISPSQLALAWVFTQGEEVVPLVGTTKRTHLEENAKAADITLSEEDLARLDEIAPKGVAVGDRYEDMSTIDF